MPTDWTRTESEAAITAYAEMLERELRGERIVKAAYNRRVQEATGRSKGSVEYKFQNVSAVFTELGYAYVGGYLPAYNYQRMLLDLSAGLIERDVGLRSAMEDAAQASEPGRKPTAGLHEVDAPAREGSPMPRRLRERRSAPRVTNWLEVEARNVERGRLGETLVLEWEERRLRAAGAARLASRIEHVSATQGDGIGFDIHSFETDGADRLIEVKATRFGEYTPFFASVNEVAVSAEHADRWHLYRVFDVLATPRFFSRRGALAEQFVLDPAVYRASVSGPAAIR